MAKESTILVNTDTFPVIIYTIVSLIVALVIILSPRVNEARTANTAAGCVSIIFITLFLLLILYDKIHKIILWLIIAISLTVEIFIIFWFAFYTNNQSIFD